MEKELHKIALELKRIRIALEKQNSMVADINSNNEFYINAEELSSTLKPLIDNENIIESRLRGIR